MAPITSGRTGRSGRSRRMLPLVVALMVAALTMSGCGMQAYDLPLPGKQVDSEEGYQVTATFRDVVDVVPRTTVMANDVPIGQVDSVQRDGWNAEVTMTIRKDIELPANAVADIRRTSLLGEKYLALTAPQGRAATGTLAAGAEIPLARTAANPEVEEVLGALSFLLSGGGVGQIKTITTELNDMMNGRQSDINGLLHQLDTLMGSLDKQKSSIVVAMKHVNALTRTLNREKGAITEAIDTFPKALRVLRDQHDGLMQMLDSLDRLGTVATRVINTSGDELTASLRDLQPVLNQLADADDSLPAGLMMAASFPFPKQAESLAKGDYSNALFQMDLDLDKLLKGVFVDGETGLPQLLELCEGYAPSCGKIRPVVQALCDLTKQPYLCQMAETPLERANKLREQAQGGDDSADALQDFTDDLTGDSGQTAKKKEPAEDPSDESSDSVWPEMDEFLGGGE